MKKTKTIIEWNDKEFNAALKLDMTSRMAIAAIELEKLVKVSFPDSGIKNATAEQRAENRSKPGEIPHVDTGRLRASISSNWTYSGRATGKVGSLAKVEGMGNPGGRYPIIKGVVGSNVNYAQNLEIGDSKMKARPYLRPALDRSKPMIKKIFGVK